MQGKKTAMFFYFIILLSYSKLNQIFVDLNFVARV